MTVLGLLIPISLLLSVAGVAAFVWAVRSDQFSDMEGDAARILTEGPARGRPTSAEDDAKGGGSEA